MKYLELKHNIMLCLVSERECRKIVKGKNAETFLLLWFDWYRHGRKKNIYM